MWAPSNAMGQSPSWYAAARPTLRTSFPILKAAQTLGVGAGRSVPRHQSVYPSHWAARYGDGPRYPTTTQRQIERQPRATTQMNNVLSSEAAMKGHYPKGFVGDPPNINGVEEGDEKSHTRLLTGWVSFLHRRVVDCCGDTGAFGGGFRGDRDLIGQAEANVIRPRHSGRDADRRAN